MTLTFTVVDGIGEITAGDDLPAIIDAATDLVDGDVVVVTSKIVSKAAGLATTIAKDDLLAAQTDRVVAQRDETRIVRTHHGLTMAAAGIDASNTRPGTLLPLPDAPDEEAAVIRRGLAELSGHAVAVVISDTAGRPWREGQTDIAIGCAGLLPLESFAGRTDTHGNPLVVTAPAIADEIAGAAEIASGKLGTNPVIIVRGVPEHLLLAEDGPGAAALIRPEEGDLFGLGARDAVLAALSADGAPVRGFGSTNATLHDLIALAAVPDEVEITLDDAHVCLMAPATHLAVAGAFGQRLTALVAAHSLDLDVEITFCAS